MECPFCHQQITDGTKKCYHCGADMPTPDGKTRRHKTGTTIAFETFLKHLNKARALLAASLIMSGAAFAGGGVWLLVLILDRVSLMDSIQLVSPLIVVSGLLFFVLSIIRHILKAMEYYVPK